MNRPEKTYKIKLMAINPRYEKNSTCFRYITNYTTVNNSLPSKQKAFY